MTEKTEELKSSDAAGDLADKARSGEAQIGDDYTGHVTLAHALEVAHNTAESCRGIHNKMIEELELFRAAVLEEKRERKVAKRKLDTHDVLLFIGLATTSVGVSFAYHWSFALIALGITLSCVSVLPLIVRVLKGTGD